MRLFLSLCLVVAFALTAGRVRAEEVAVGSKAPAVTLKDQNGKTTSLDALLKDGHVALVFHRSASW